MAVSKVWRRIEGGCRFSVRDPMTRQAESSPPTLPDAAVDRASNAEDTRSSSTSQEKDARLETNAGLPELARWIQARRGSLADRWLADLVSRHDRISGDEKRLLSRFISLLVSVLPVAMGPQREQGESIWRQATELYGSFGGVRGLVAGEIVEEFQIIREAIIRNVYSEPPFGGAAPLSLRDVLRLNRLIDRGVAQASVGHTDALFFAFFQGSGVSKSLSSEAVDELDEQLSGLEKQIAQLSIHAG